MHERVRTPPHKTNRTHATIKKHTPTTHTHTTSINHAQKQDVVEPLESVSVTLAPTDKKDVSEFGDIADVADTLAKKVLTAPGQEVSVVSTTPREAKGTNYYEFEFTAKTPKYTRHSLAVVAVSDGKFYTLTTGANERRWGKMKDKLTTVVRSFSFINVFAS